MVSLTVDKIDLTMKYQYLTVCIDILTIHSVSVFISQNFDSGVVLHLSSGNSIFFWHLSSGILLLHLSNGVNSKLSSVLFHHQ